MSYLVKQARQFAKQLRVAASSRVTNAKESARKQIALAQEDAAWMHGAADTIERLLERFERAMGRTLESYEQDRQPVPSDLRQPSGVRRMLPTAYHRIDDPRLEAQLKTYLAAIGDLLGIEQEDPTEYGRPDDVDGGDDE